MQKQGKSIRAIRVIKLNTTVSNIRIINIFKNWNELVKKYCNSIYIITVFFGGVWDNKSYSESLNNTNTTRKEIEGQLQIFRNKVGIWDISSLSVILNNLKLLQCCTALIDDEPESSVCKHFAFSQFSNSYCQTVRHGSESSNHSYLLLIQSSNTVKVMLNRFTNPITESGDLSN